MGSYWPPPIPASTAWPDVAIAFIYGLPAIIAAVYSWLNARKIKTPSGATIGKQVEDTHHASIVAATQAMHVAKAVGAPVVDNERTEGL